MEKILESNVSYDDAPLIGGKIREVTITLAEYRELVIAKTEYEMLKKLNKISEE